MTAECPACDDVFDSERGMKIHYSRYCGEAEQDSIAGESVNCSYCGDEKRVDPHIVRDSDRHFCDKECKGKWQSENWGLDDNPAYKEIDKIECENCGISFRPRPYQVEYRKYCTRECHAEDKVGNFAGENNPSWAGGQACLECEQCNSAYKVDRHKEGWSRFCSNECRGGWISEAWVGENHPGWQGGEIELECEYCGGGFMALRANKDRRKFCSRDCSGKWMSKNVNGQDHPLWRGGKCTYDAVKKQLHGLSWTAIRERCTADKCYQCGSADNLHLHHIVPIMAGGTNEAWNLMTLCGSCHTTVENYTRSITDAVLTEE